MICVGIGRGRHRHVIAEHKFLAEQGVGLVELRLDYIQGPVQVKRLLKDRPCPVIVTCRRAADGGRWEQSEEARLLVLRTAIVEGADYVDLEDDIAAAVPRFGATKRIISHHDFHKTPTDLTGLHRRLAGLDADIVKIATMANQSTDTLRMLELMHSATIPTIGLCMGDIGTPSRVLAGRYGAPFTYATFNDDRVLAPGQIGWRQMRDVYRYDSIPPATKIYGVVADPVGHSLSPVVHNAALAATGIDAVYLPFRVPGEQIDAFLDSAGKWPLAGLSVTIPHKQRVLAHATHQDDLVRSIGAANTLAFRSDGIAAFNTDATAAVESLRSSIIDDEEGHETATKSGLGIRTALVLGAGGAARAVAFGLRERNVEVTVTARTLDHAQRIAKEVGCKVVEWDSRHRIPQDCIINATPVGMHPDVNDTPFPKSHLQSYMVVFDTVYNPENTLLIKEARAVGCRTVTGVDMFVRQAAHQFKIWHGSNAPESVMRDALKRATASAKLPD
ncbi:MAG: shikimate dehydrogenase [Planctomycetota bacterium]|nr:shikimate dehydrogenase [Planctomycetota bacterium]